MPKKVICILDDGKSSKEFEPYKDSDIEHLARDGVVIHVYELKRTIGGSDK